jgi:dihydrodipicolinate synthase/N-acetylneuraminate lyase
MTNGTLGEIATLTDKEWQSFAVIVAEAVADTSPDMPLFVGATASNTRDTAARIRFLHGLGVRGVFVGRPMWSALGPEALYAFYCSLVDAFPDMAMVLYDNPEAFKGPIPTPVYEQLSKMPQVVGAKYTALTPKYSADMYAVGNNMRLMPIESDWFAASSLFPDQAIACWSSSALCGPEPVVQLRDFISDGNHGAARALTHRMEWAYEPFLARTNFPEFSRYNIALEKARFVEAKYVNAGPARAPYHVVPEKYVEGALENGRRWRQLVAESTDRGKTL